MSDAQASLNDSAARIKVVADFLEAWARGGSTAIVPNGNGTDVPSPAKTIADILASVQLFANPAASEGIGRAAVADGTLFAYYGSGTGIVLAKRDVGGASSTTLEVFPSKAYFDTLFATGIFAMLSNVVGSTEFVATDGDGYAWWRVGPSSFRHPIIDLLRSDLNSALAAITALQAGSGSIIGQQIGPTEFAMTDADLYRWFSVTPSELKHAVIDTLKSRLTNTERRAALPAPNPQWDSIAATGEILHLEGTGQSLSRGHASFAPSGSPNVLTTSAVAGALRFAGGVRPDDNSMDPAVIYASLVGLTEQYVNIPPDTTQGNADGETPMSGAAQMIIQLLKDEDGIDLSLTGTNQKLLVSCAGKGGTPVSGLVPSATAQWQRVLDHQSYGKSLAESAGASYASLGITFTQGETDTANSADPTAYLASVRSIRTGARDAMRTLTGTQREYPMVLYQVACHRNFSKDPVIALAQLSLCNEDYYGLATPTYFLPFNPSDIHLSGTGSKWLGAYYGLMVKRWMWDRYKRPPMVPTVWRDGNKLIAKFPLETGRRLVIGTERVALQSNFGLTAVDGSGSSVTLSNARLAGRDTVVVDTASAPAVGWKLRYAWQGGTVLGLGNLRDDNPTIFDPTGLALRMYRYAPIFEASVQ